MALRVSNPLTNNGSAPEHDIPALVRYWLMYLLIECGASERYLSREKFIDSVMAKAIGLPAYDECEDPDEVQQKKMHGALLELYRAAKDLPREVPPVLAANVQRIGELVGLSECEKRVFEFAVLMRAYPILFDLCGRPRDLRPRQMAMRLAGLLGLNAHDVYLALRPQSALARSGLLTVSKENYQRSLQDGLELMSESLPECLIESIMEPAEWLREMVRPGEPAHLQWRDYEHLSKPLGLLRPYLRKALEEGRSGVNIFLYGPPGTGKTQLARLLAQDMGCELFEVSTEDSDGDPISGPRRIKAHCAANSFFTKQRAVILFDEVEEVFAQDGDALGFLKLLSPGSTLGHKRKGWINRILETNALPTVWVANSLNGLDPAFARRFDMLVEMPVPPRSHRERIIRDASRELLSPQAVAQLAQSDRLTAGVVATAVKVTSSIGAELPCAASDAVHLLVNGTLQAQGHKPVRAHNPDDLPQGYDPAFIHADTDLAEVTRMLQAARTGRLCLYGPPGTGKTAYGRWLAQQLGVPLHVRRASDLLGMFVGESEKNIAQAFAEAEADNGVLLIDEVDSFLQDRQGAERSWEVSQVNEMLTQLESFSGVFIASTNLMGKLDPAVLRRFDLKVRFDPLRADQAVQLLQRHCEQQGLEAPSEQDLYRLRQLTQLTPGDFAAVLRQSRLRALRSAADWVRALEAECELKPKLRNKGGMGFI